MPLAPNASAPLSTVWLPNRALYNPCVENGVVPANASAPLSTAWSPNRALDSPQVENDAVPAKVVRRFLRQGRNHALGATPR